MIQVISYIKNNPGNVDIKVLHRFSDNASCQYKWITSLSHIPLFKDIHGVDVRYHYCEPGHGKGPSDGLGATFKQKLTSLVLSDRAVIRNAYEAYLAGSRTLNQVGGDDTRPSQKLQFEMSCREVLYVPAKAIKQNVPTLPKRKPILGTQKIRSVNMGDGRTVSTSELSCTCFVCLGVEEGPCFFSRYRSIKLFKLLALR